MQPLAENLSLALMLLLIVALIVWGHPDDRE